MVDQEWNRTLGTGHGARGTGHGMGPPLHVLDGTFDAVGVGYHSEGLLRADADADAASAAAAAAAAAGRSAAVFTGGHTVHVVLGTTLGVVVAACVGVLLVLFWLVFVCATKAAEAAARSGTRRGRFPHRDKPVYGTHGGVSRPDAGSTSWWRRWLCSKHRKQGGGGTPGRLWAGEGGGGWGEEEEAAAREEEESPSFTPSFRWAGSVIFMPGIQGGAVHNAAADSVRWRGRPPQRHRGPGRRNKGVDWTLGLCRCCCGADVDVDSGDMDVDSGDVDLEDGYRECY